MSNSSSYYAVAHLSEFLLVCPHQVTSDHFCVLFQSVWKFWRPLWVSPVELHVKNVPTTSSKWTRDANRKTVGEWVLPTIWTTTTDESVKRSVSRDVKKRRLSWYVKWSDILHINDSGMFHCTCGNTICLWEVNKQMIQTTNDLLLSSTATNKEKRFYSYKQFAYILHGYLGKGHCRQLPQCVVDGVRGLYPDEGGEYTGFKPE